MITEKKSKQEVRQLVAILKTDGPLTGSAIKHRTGWTDQAFARIVTNASFEALLWEEKQSNNKDVLYGINVEV